MIRFDDVTMRYAHSPLLRLDRVSFEVEEGELCLVVGPTGAGKSTLLGAVNNLVPRFTGGTRTGRIFIDDVDTTLTPTRELATTVGYVGQNPMAGFVTDIVEEELAYSMEQLGFPEAEMRRRVEETLDLLGIAELRRRPLRTLSGGQQQRVAIGSVLCSAPKVLVLDEPTSALDPIAAEEVLALISRLVRDLGTTVLLAEHRMERVIEFADSALLVLPDATVRHGPVGEILRGAPVQPPLIELGIAERWEPLPLTIREARRMAREQRRQWAEQPPQLPAPERGGEVVLRADDIVVQYPGVVAVRGVNLHLRQGEVTALMGRNGCGKSSLLWAVQGAGEKSSGHVDATGRVALVPQTASDLLYLASVRAECEASDQAADVPDGTTAKLLLELVPSIDLDTHPRDLSEGQKIAVVLAAELVGDPQVVLLDEPTRGLDYAAKGVLSSTIARMAAEGRSILIATHDVEMAARTCGRVVVMAEGELVSDGPARDVLASSQLLATQVSKVASPVPLLTVEEFHEAAR
uniref:ABC transporter ATP-binding protein n=1 Tax=Tessaracoccus timonensis TaxID=2161816 RepID=UPI000D54F4ED|nr:ABC transporter ATP-binding protein [Tessaracoccus timonensis]